MGKVLVFADVHVDRHGGSEQRLQETLDALSWVYKVAVEKQVDAVVCAGDLFHNRARIDVQAMHSVYTIISEANLNTIFVLGNHDMFYRHRHDVSSIKVLESFGYVVDSPTSFKLCGLPCDFMPYVEDNPGGALQHFQHPSPVLFGHMAVEGAILNSLAGTRSSEKAIEQDDSVEDATGIKLAKRSVFNGRQLVLLGHYHAAQVVSESPRVEYVGSALQLSYGEAGDNKRVVILHTDSMQLESVYYNDSPKYVIFDITGDVPQDEEHVAAMLGVVKDCRVRLRVDPACDPLAVTELRHRIVAEGNACSCEKRDVALIRTKPEQQGEVGVLESLQTDIPNDPFAVIRRYLAYANKADDNALLAAGSDIVTAVASKSGKRQFRAQGASSFSLKRLVIKNFMSVGEEPVDIAFEDMEKLIVVSGANNDVSSKANNGCGKSTVFVEALCWCLYGETLRKLRKAECVNDLSGKQCEVSAYVNDIIITRGVKPDKLIVRSLDGEDETKSTIAETEAWIASKLGIAWDTFSYLVCYDSETMFSLLGAPESKRREFIESALGINLSSYLEEVRAKKKANKDALAKSEADYGRAKAAIEQSEAWKEKIEQEQERRYSGIQRDISAVEAELTKKKAIDAESIRAHIDAYEKYIVEKRHMDKCVADIAANAKALAAELKKAENEFSEAKASCEQAQKTIDGHTEESVAAETNVIKEQRDLATELRDKLSQAKSLSDSIRGDTKRIAREIEQLRAKRSEISSMARGACPVCLQIVTEDGVESVCSHLDEEIAAKASLIEKANKKLSTALSGAKSIQEAIDGLSLNDLDDRSRELGKISAMLGYVDDLRRRVASCESNIEWRREKLDAENKKLAEASGATLDHVPEPSMSRKELEQAISEVKVCEAKLQSLVDALREDPYVSQLEKLESDKRNNMKLFTAAESAIRTWTDQLAYNEFWDEAFASGIRQMIMEEIRHALNIELDHWLSSVLGGDVELELDAGFEPTLTYKTTGKSSSYRKLSAGEKRRVNIAILLAFSKVMLVSLDTKMDYIVFDEPVDKLDYEGVLGAIEAFRELTRSGRRVVVITHNKMLAEELAGEAEHIRVVREFGVTKLGLSGVQRIGEKDTKTSLVEDGSIRSRQ